MVGLTGIGLVVIGLVVVGLVVIGLVGMGFVVIGLVLVVLVVIVSVPMRGNSSPCFSRTVLSQRVSRLVGVLGRRSILSRGTGSTCRRRSVALALCSMGGVRRERGRWWIAEMVG